MNIATLTGACIAVFVLAAGFIYLRRTAAPRGFAGSGLRWLALAATLAIAIATAPTAMDDRSGLIWFVGVPVLIALLPVAADATARGVGIVTGAAAVAMLFVGLFLAMLLTYYFVVPALILGVAALVSIPPRVGTESRSPDNDDAPT